MRVQKIICIIYLIIISLQATIAQEKVSLCSEKPRLVLIILIDNLNNEQLEIVRSRCGKEGINRIINNGAQFCNAYYDAGSNFSGKNLASFFTGAPASTHGIVGENWIDHFSNKKINAIYGDAYDTKGHIDTAAVPQNGMLLCSTIGNEIRKIYNDKAKIYSIGFNPQELMWASSTSSAEPTMWFDTKTGAMTSLGFEPDTSNNWINEFNSKQIPDLYLTKIWAPKTDIIDYHEWRYFNTGTQQRTFYYQLNNSKKNKYTMVAGSPYGNNLIRDFAASAIINEKIGKDEIPDIMTVEFSAMPACGKKSQPLDAETEDMLLCLDDNIASLLKVIDYDIGMDNTLVIFSAAQSCYDVANTQSEQWKSKGAVSLRRITALLNLYLMAIHGQGQWVRNYSSGAIYLDRKLADEHKVQWDSLLNETADFLLQVTGIGTAIPAKNLSMISSDSPIVGAMRRNCNPKRSGDILIALEPGWAEEQDDGTELTQLWGREFVPLTFYGWKVPRTVYYDTYPMTNVAPTICSFIRVNVPNGSSGELLPIVSEIK